MKSHLNSCKWAQRLLASSWSRRSLSESAPKLYSPVASPKLRLQRLADLWVRLQDGRSETILQCTYGNLRECSVIVPQELQSKVITMLHKSHRGIVRMKTKTRLYVWWPNIEMCIETCCKACNVCAVTAPAPAPAAKLSPWPLPDEPWGRIRVDFASQFLGNMDYRHGRLLKVVQRRSYVNLPAYGDHHYGA